MQSIPYALLETYPMKLRLALSALLSLPLLAQAAPATSPLLVIHGGAGVERGVRSHGLAAFMDRSGTAASSRERGREAQDDL